VCAGPDGFTLPAAGFAAIGDLGSFTLFVSILFEAPSKGLPEPWDSHFSRWLLRLRTCFPRCSICMRSFLLNGLNFDIPFGLFVTGRKGSLKGRPEALETIGF
jgi:hypothetical protein